MISIYLILQIVLLSSIMSTRDSIKVMSFNIRYGTANDGENSWQFRKSIVFDVFEIYQCDFVGAQEAMMFQVREITEEVPSYAFIGRTRHEDPEKDEASPIFYLKDRWEVLESGTLWLSETPEVVASESWNTALPRIFTWGKFRHRQNGISITVYNTHYDHQSAEARKHSSEVILAHMKKNTDGNHIILTGDLNAQEDEPPVTRLVNDPDIILIDSYRHLYPQKTEKEGTYHGWKSDTPVRRIDYVFNSEDVRPMAVEIMDYNVNGRYPSDHKPVFVQLKLN